MDAAAHSYLMFGGLLCLSERWEVQNTAVPVIREPELLLEVLVNTSSCAKLFFVFLKVFLCYLGVVKVKGSTVLIEIAICQRMTLHHK